MKQIIHLESWERRDNFNFFKDFVNPFISITVEIDCTKAKQRAQDKGESFFLHYLHAIFHAFNEIKEFRYRIEADGQIVLYDHVDILTPIQVPGSWQFYTLRIPWQADFNAFCREAQRLMANISPNAPFSDESQCIQAETLDVIHLSATPNLYFTSVSSCQKHQNGSDFPLSYAGKAILREGRWIMPVGLSFHHGFVDGFHVSEFISLTTRYMDAF